MGGRAVTTDVLRPFLAAVILFAPALSLWLLVLRKKDFGALLEMLTIVATLSVITVPGAILLLNRTFGVSLTPESMVATSAGLVAFAFTWSMVLRRRLGPYLSRIARSVGLI